MLFLYKVVERHRQATLPSLIHGFQGCLVITIVAHRRWGKTMVECMWEIFKGQAWKSHTSLLFTFHWRELSYMATPHLQGGWKMCLGRREEWILTDHWQSLPQSCPSGHPCLALLPFLGHTYPSPEGTVQSPIQLLTQNNALCSVFSIRSRYGWTPQIPSIQ